jgi:hypothetical protein
VLTSTDREPHREQKFHLTSKRFQISQITISNN